MSSCCLFLTCLVFWVLSTSIFIKITFAFSTLSCHEYHSQPSVVSCLQTCHNFTYNKPVSVAILPQMVAQSTIIVRCEEVIQTKVFTETWTLSKVEGGVEERISSTSITECLKEWEQKCDKKECRTKDPSFSDHYSWATTEVSSLKFIRVYAENTSIIEVISDDPKVNVEGRSISVKERGVIFHDHTYAWDLPTIDTKCPWDSPTHTTVCYDVGGRLACPSQGISMSKAIEIKTNCKFQVFKDITGIVFSPVGPLVHDYYPIPSLTIDTGLKQTIEGVRLALNIRDMQNCRYQCISMSGGYMKIDDNYYVKQDGQWLECNLMPNCTIGVQSLSCNDGELIQAYCLGKPTWVNMTTAIGLRAPNCTKPNSKPIGKAEVYALLNQYHTSHSLFNLLSSDEISDIALTYLDRLKDLKVYSINVTQGVTHLERHLDVLAPIKFVMDKVGKLTHQVKKLIVGGIFGILSIVSLYWTIKAFFHCMKIRRLGKPSVRFQVVPKIMEPITMKSF
ncbi:TPA_asm: G [Panicum betacytorhabdovirus 1]|nr:TPA_asm: G [Panicum betacytorhabdovirus 1]